MKVALKRRWTETMEKLFPDDESYLEIVEIITTSASIIGLTLCVCQSYKILSMLLGFARVILRK